MPEEPESGLCLALLAPDDGGFREMMREARRTWLKVSDMSRKGKAGLEPAGGWLDVDQRRAWLAYIRVQLRLAYEMNRQLLADSGMSLPDYDVPLARGVADAVRVQINGRPAVFGL